MVGRVTAIDPEIIHTLANKGFIPVIAPVGVGRSGETYNINADLVASKIASALKAERLILMTDVDGLLDGSATLVSSAGSEQIHAMIQRG